MPSATKTFLKKGFGFQKTLNAESYAFGKNVEDTLCEKRSFSPFKVLESQENFFQEVFLQGAGRSLENSGPGRSPENPGPGQRPGVSLVPP